MFAFIFILSKNMIFSNQNKKSPLLAKIKFETTFFQVLWRFAFSLPLSGEASGIPPTPPFRRALAPTAKNFCGQLTT